MTQRTRIPLTGPELAAVRRKAGLTQTELARAAGIGRHAVSYWESKAVVLVHQHAPRRMLRVLGTHAEDAAYLPVNARARGDGVLPFEEAYSARMAARRADRALQAQPARKAPALARKAPPPPEPVLCGARTRKGQPCRMAPEPDRTRCKFHGGKSTGPRTAEGRARIADAQRRRWAAQRASKRQDEAVT